MDKESVEDRSLHRWVLIQPDHSMYLYLETFSDLLSEISIRQRDLYWKKYLMLWTSIILSKYTEPHAFDKESVTAERYRDENLEPDVCFFGGTVCLQFVFMDSNSRSHLGFLWWVFIPDILPIILNSCETYVKCSCGQMQITFPELSRTWNLVVWFLEKPITTINLIFHSTMKFLFKSLLRWCVFRTFICVYHDSCMIFFVVYLSMSVLNLFKICQQF